MDPKPEGKREVRRKAEAIRHELKVYVRHGGSEASFLPRVKRAHRHVRKGDLDAALRVLGLVEAQIRSRLPDRND